MTYCLAVTAVTALMQDRLTQCTTVAAAAAAAARTAGERFLLLPL